MRLWYGSRCHQTFRSLAKYICMAVNFCWRLASPTSLRRHGPRAIEGGFSLGLGIVVLDLSSPFADLTSTDDEEGAHSLWRRLRIKSYTYSAFRHTVRLKCNRDYRPHLRAAGCVFSPSALTADSLNLPVSSFATIHARLDMKPSNSDHSAIDISISRDKFSRWSSSTTNDQ